MGPWLTRPSFAPPPRPPPGINGCVFVSSTRKTNFGRPFQYGRFYGKRFRDGVSDLAISEPLAKVPYVNTPQLRSIRHLEIQIWPNFFIIIFFKKIIYVHTSTSRILHVEKSLVRRAYMELMSMHVSSGHALIRTRLVYDSYMIMVRSYLDHRHGIRIPCT